MPDDKATIDFGYEEVPIAEKATKVAHVFHSVANLSLIHI